MIEIARPPKSAPKKERKKAEKKYKKIMKKNKKISKSDRPDAHVFVCTHKRDKGESCGEKNSKELRQKLKEMIRENPEWTDRVKISQSGCLGLCSMGIAAVLYPNGQWFTEQKADSPHEIKEAVDELLSLKKTPKEKDD